MANAEQRSLQKLSLGLQAIDLQPSEVRDRVTWE